jgi:hypothetical protein
MGSISPSWFRATKHVNPLLPWGCSTNPLLCNTKMDAGLATAGGEGSQLAQSRKGGKPERAAVRITDLPIPGYLPAASNALAHPDCLCNSQPPAIMSRRIPQNLSVYSSLSLANELIAVPFATVARSCLLKPAYSLTPLIVSGTMAWVAKT